MTVRPRATAAKAPALCSEGGQGSHRAVGGINHLNLPGLPGRQRGLGDTQRDPTSSPSSCVPSWGGAAVTKSACHNAAAALRG